MTKPRKMLWVDDDAGSLLAPLRRLLESQGIQVDIALDAVTALHKIESVDYDALLVDLILPYKGGEPDLSSTLGSSVIRRLRDLERERGRNERIPVVILSVIRKDEVLAEIGEFAAEHFDKTSLLNPQEIHRLVESLSTPDKVAEPRSAGEEAGI